MPCRHPAIICFQIPLILLYLCIQASAIELVVPDDFPMISFAMEMAESGDTIIVKPGVYNERIKLKDGVSLVSYAGDDGDELVQGPGRKKVLRRALRTIIDGSDIEEPGYLLSFPQEATGEMMVDGFTFRNMPKYVSSLQLFLMEIRGCSPVVTNCIFTGNKSGGGILSTGLGVGMGAPIATAKPLITNNVIYGNMGTGIANGSNSGALITNNELFDNRFPEQSHKQQFAPAIGVREQARPLIENNLCYHNETGIGAINFDANTFPNLDKDLVIRGNEIYENLMGGIGIRGIGGANIKNRVIIENNTIYANMEAGIRCTKLDMATIRDNRIYSNRKSGVSLWNVQRGIITGNEIFKNYTAGVRLLAVPMVSLKKNSIYENVTAGVDFIGWKKKVTW